MLQACLIHCNICIHGENSHASNTLTQVSFTVISHSFLPGKMNINRKFKIKQHTSRCVAKLN